MSRSSKIVCWSLLAVALLVALGWILGPGGAQDPAHQAAPGASEPALPSGTVLVEGEALESAPASGPVRREAPDAPAPEAPRTTPGRWLSVVDGQSGAALVPELTLPSGTEHEPGPDGRVRLTAPPGHEAPLEVDVAVEGYTPASVRVDRRHDSPQRALVVRLWRDASLLVRVLDASGLPVPGARVEVANQGPGPGGGNRTRMLRAGGRVHVFRDAGPERQGTTDAAGECRFESLPAWTRLVALTRPGMLVDDGVFLEPGERAEVVLRPPRNVLVGGIVVDEAGLPVPAQVVWCLPASPSGAPDRLQLEPEDEPSFAAQRATSDSLGRFEFGYLPEGAYHLGCAPPSPGDDERSFVPLARLVHLTLPDEHPRELELRVVAEAGAFLPGQVLSPAHEPLPGARVRVASAAGDWLSAATTDLDGNFLAGPLPAGRVTVQAGAEGGHAPSEVRTLTLPRDLEPCILQLRPAGRVRARLAAGHLDPGTKATWSLCSAAGSLHVVHGASGEAEFDAVEHGDWLCRVVLSTGQVGEARVRAGLAEATVVLAPEPAFEIQIRSLLDRPLRAHLERGGHALEALYLEPLGRQALLLLEGDHLLRWSQDDQQHELPFRVGPGEESELLLGP